jgi:uncharacterized membrane protein
VRIMPPYIPGHLAMVRISRALEIIGGLGLLVQSVRWVAAWMLVALLIAVFPANIYMAMHAVEAGAAGIAPVLRWASVTSASDLVAAVVHAASVRAAFTPDLTGRGRLVCRNLSEVRRGRIGDNAKLHAAHVRCKFSRTVLRWATFRSGVATSLPKNR